MLASNETRSRADRLAADEAEIRRQILRVAEGLHVQDLETVAQAYAADVVSFDIEAPLQHVGIAAKLANWSKVFEFFETVTYEFRELTFTVGDDVAFGHGFARLSGRLRNGTETGGMWVRVTYGLRKIEGTWLIVHDQVSVPLDMPAGTPAIDLEP